MSLEIPSGALSADGSRIEEEIGGRQAIAARRVTRKAPPDPGSFAVQPALSSGLVPCVVLQGKWTIGLYIGFDNFRKYSSLLR
jgi:hypothetical protein